ncbi:unnamed protein product [Effrenium voratum]|nr:unnamed protein product [Effrenium voratum]
MEGFHGVFAFFVMLLIAVVTRGDNGVYFRMQSDCPDKPWDIETQDSSGCREKCFLGHLHPMPVIALGILFLLCMERWCAGSDQRYARVGKNTLTASKERKERQFLSHHS